MKPRLLLILLMAMQYASGQTIITANNCFDKKDYPCALENYKKSLDEKSYAEKDYATVLYRIGFCLGEMKRGEEAIKYLEDAIVARPDYASAVWLLAGSLYDAGKYEEALEHYTKSIGLYSNTPSSLKTLYYWRGRSYRQLKKYTESLADFRSAMAIDSSNGGYNANAGDMAYNLALYTDAVRYYQRSIQAGDNDKKVMSARYYWLGETYYKQKKYNEAMTAYKGAIEYNQENKDAMWALAAVHYDEKRWTEGVAAYARTMTYYVSDTASMKKLYYLRGRCYVGEKQYAKAMEDMDAAIRIDSRYGSALWQHAYILYLQKKYKEAIVSFDRAIERYKGEKDDLDDLTYYRGYCYLQLKDTTKAKADFLQSLVYNYNLMDPSVQLANISYAARKYYEARDYFNKGLANYKSDSAELSVLYFRKGFSNYALGNTYLSSAREDLRKSIGYDSLNKEAHRFLADVYYSESNFGMAEKELDNCVHLYRNHKDSLPRMYLYRGMARSQQKKYKETLADYEQSDKLKKFALPDDVKSLGQLAFEIKDYPKAITHFTRLIPMYAPDQKNELLFAYYGRGRSALELKKKPQAVADLKKALEYSPGNQEIQGWLTKAEAL